MTTRSDVEWIARRIYKNGVDKDALTSSNALLRHVSTETAFSSNEGIYISTPLSNGQGVGTTAAGAYANRVGNKGSRFAVPQRTLRFYGELTDEVLKNAEYGTSETQLINAVTNDIDGATETFGQELNVALYGTNLGVRAYANFSSAVATLTDAAGNLTPEAVTLFEPGMRIVAMNPADSTLRDSGDYVTVLKVDPIAGTVTADGNWSGISGITNLDGLLRQDELSGMFDGLQGWAPVTPSASFLGVNQTLAPGRVCGTYVDISGYGTREGFIRGFAKFKLQLGNAFDEKAPIFMNPTDVAEIIASVEAIRCVEGEMPTSYNVGLKTIKVNGYTLVEDRHCPVGMAFLVPKDAFTLGTAGPMADLFKPAGQRFTYNPQTGNLAFCILTLGNSYSRGVARLGRLKLSTRTL